MTKFDVVVKEVGYKGSFVSQYDAETKLEAMEEAIEFVRACFYDYEDVELVATAKVVR